MRKLIIMKNQKEDIQQQWNFHVDQHGLRIILGVKLKLMNVQCPLMIHSNSKEKLQKERTGLTAQNWDTMMTKDFTLAIVNF